MPIQFDDAALFAQAPVAAMTPKFFHKELTGSGKSAGMLSSFFRPGRYAIGEARHTLPTDMGAKTRETSASITTSRIPLGVLTQYSVEQNANLGLSFPVPKPEDLFEVTAAATSLPYDLYLGMTPQGVLIREDGTGDRVSREIRMLYRMEAYMVPVGTSPASARLVDNTPYSLPEAVVLMDWSYAPLDDAEALLERASSALTPHAGGAFVDVDALAEWMAEYDVHERVVRLAEEWSSVAIADAIGDHVSQLFASGTPSNDVLNRLASQLRYLETYNVSLEAYRRIHTTIMTVCPPDIATALNKQNLNLLMSLTLTELDGLKPQLSSPPNTGRPSTLDPRFSTQQRTAIMTNEPLTLVQAGAGTGKSTVILARIQHLVDQGVDPADITVLSFTNAAADNIRERNSSVGSMTIARMIHDIYSLNYPQHELSSIDTILNSIDIYFPTDSVAIAFRRRILEMSKKVAGATTALNAFVEHYSDDVLRILDTIKQVCLELEIIIAYQQIDTMAEPPHVRSRYLIVDEVQDNSIFEFIYSLKYVAKHRENLFIVGDASQTLFEFRASNPKALNALESSGVFATYPLTTNYRSNQSILDFANRSLVGIEANQIARIQLRANSLAASTAKEFTERVRLDYRYYQRITEFQKDLPAYMMNVVRPYVDECLERGEQIAFLAYDRRSVAVMEESLKSIYPGQEIANLVSEKSYSTTVFSEFIKKHWDEVRQASNLANASYLVRKGIDDHLDTLVKDPKKARPAIMNMISKWWTENASSIQAWVHMANAGGMTADQFFEDLKENILRFEIAHNAVKQALLNQRKKERKEKNLQSKARLVVSTVHGAKGLEFDNVVILYKFDSQMDEPSKRLYYVALTRAINTEFILAYGSIKKPKIETDYKMVVDDLLAKERIAALASQGVDVGIMSEDEVEAALALLEQRSEEAAASGDLATAAALRPSDVDFSTRGQELPRDDEEDEDEDKDGGDAGAQASASAFTA